MFSSFKKVLSVAVMAAGMFSLTAGSWADSGYRPTYDGGNFGLGIELGDPGAWGISGKLWADSVNAFQPAVKFNNGGAAILQLDYLWHNFDIVHVENGGLPFYIGLGGDILLENSVQFAGRLPVGLSYIFDKRNFPVDLYFQVVPTLWFFTGGLTTFYFYPEVGAHIYL